MPEVKRGQKAYRINLDLDLAPINKYSSVLICPFEKKMSLLN